MNLLKIGGKEEKKPREWDVLDDDDCSDLWSLPSWPELHKARALRDKKIARLKRLKRRDERRKLKEELKNDQAEDPQLMGAASAGSIATQDEDLDDDDMKERGQWNNSCEFLMSIISMSVGMGNFYRFPFIAYQNGGGAFLIPYLIVMTLVGRPLYLLELAIGQFCSYGQVKVWDMSPLFRGVGYGSAIASFMVVSYYSAVMGITFYYFFYSLAATLPWTWCNPKWAGKETCEKALNLTRQNKSIDLRSLVNLPQLYYDNEVIGEKPQIYDGIGTPQPMQTFCLFVSWLLIYIIIAKGVESSGKAAYVTTIYPFIVIVIILIAACLRKGAYSGILYFVSPVWGKMLDPDVWFAALGQCFFTLTVGFGPITNYASFNPFHHNIFKDALVVSVMDTMASVLAGLTVFATLGSLSFQMKKPITEVIADGPGLVFVIFSDAIKNFDYFAYSPQIMAALFFTMLLMLAAGSAVAWVLSAICVICDNNPSLNRFYVTTITCVIGFLMSLIYTTPGGQFMVTLVDYFGGNTNVYILCIFECVGINWAYGLKNTVKDMEFMLNRKVSIYWKMCWGFIIPVLLTVVLTYALITSERLQHNGHPFPDSAIACGVLVTLTSLIPIPVLAGLTLYKQKGTFKERLLTALKPLDEYGPRNRTNRERWKLYKKGIIKAGPGPDVYQLPPGETRSDNNLPDWLTVLEDGTVLRRKDVQNASTEELSLRNSFPEVHSNVSDPEEEFNEQPEVTHRSNRRV